MAGRGTFIVLGLIAFLITSTGFSDEKAPAAEARIAPLMKLLRTTDQPRVAMAAYARANAIDRDNTDLHVLYMRRMVKFGLPQIARYPARRLVAMDKANAMAWGLIGYVAGRQGRYGEALAASIRSAHLDEDDPSVLNNLGQLVAWYDRTDNPPRIEDADRRLLARRKERWSRRGAYAAAQTRIGKAFEKRTSLRQDLAKKIDAAEKVAAKTYREAIAADEGLRRLDVEIANHRDRIDLLLRDYYYATLYVGFQNRLVLTSDYGPYIYYPRYYYLYRDELDRRIRRARRERDKLKIRRDALAAMGAAVAADYRRKRRTLADLLRRTESSSELIERGFRWDPPAIDGQVIPERKAVPVGREVRLPDDPQGDAEQKLSLAMAYRSNGMNRKANEILRSILKDYGNTPSAGRARAILGLKPAGK